MHCVNEDMMTPAERSIALNAIPTTEAGERGRGVYYVHTLGCQMNAHDSERISGVLAEQGYVLANDAQVRSKDLDLIVLNTCAVRENATERMYGTIGQWAELKRENPRLQIAVGGCMAQKDRDRIAKRAPWVDAVFGTKNIASLPHLLDDARSERKAQVEIADELSYFPSQLPVTRASRNSAWVSISVGCNNTCTFCIVPSVRGRERDRRPGDILSEIQRAVVAGAKEVTLLGQNVNSFGYSTGDRLAFSRLLRACGSVEGLERVRFTSPHPAAFTDDVIEAMAATPNVMHQLHMPLQSGSDRVLRAMRRSYRTKRFLEILAKVRAAMPDAQVTTDIIVGFPGETEEDFQQTMDVVRQARFSSAFIFEYSPRPGTPAASMEQVDPAVVSDRFKRLHALQESITAEQMKDFQGRTVEVMVTGEGRKDSATHRITGRECGGVLVHVGVEPGQPVPLPGQFVTCTVTRTAGHYLISDPGAGRTVYEVSDHSALQSPVGLMA
jgi:tRNA-2-methylthio-N6-dimethylallyladenosine synthase